MLVRYSSNELNIVFVISKCFQWLPAHLNSTFLIFFLTGDENASEIASPQVTSVVETAVHTPIPRVSDLVWKLYDELSKHALSN